jgi:hypothetical protein
MKATHTKTPATFTPVTINITCETQEELDAWTCICNSGEFNAAVYDVFPGVSTQDAYDAFSEAGGNEGKTDDLDASIKREYKR